MSFNTQRNKPEQACSHITSCIFFQTRERFDTTKTEAASLMSRVQQVIFSFVTFSNSIPTCIYIYLLLTEFKGHTVNHGPRFSFRIYGPSTCTSTRVQAIYQRGKARVRNLQYRPRKRV